MRASAVPDVQVPEVGDVGARSARDATLRLFRFTRLTTLRMRERRGGSVCEELAAQMVIVSGSERELERRDRRPRHLDVSLRGLDELCGCRAAVGVGHHGEFTGARERHEPRIVAGTTDAGRAVAWVADDEGPALGQRDLQKMSSAMSRSRSSAGSTTLP